MSDQNTLMYIATKLVFQYLLANSQADWIVVMLYVAFSGLGDDLEFPVSTCLAVLSNSERYGEG